MKAAFIIKLCIYVYSLHHLIYYSFIIIIQIKITNNRNLEGLYILFHSSWVIFLISKWTYPFFVRHGWRTILFPGAERRSNIRLSLKTRLARFQPGAKRRSGNRDRPFYRLEAIVRWISFYISSTQSFVLSNFEYLLDPLMTGFLSIYYKHLRMKDIVKHIQ